MIPFNLPRIKKIRFNHFLIALVMALLFTSCVEDDDFKVPEGESTSPEIQGIEVPLSSVLKQLDQSILNELGADSFDEVDLGDDDVLNIIDRVQFTYEETDKYITGYVVSSDEGGNFFKEMVMQNKPENPTAGLRIAVDSSPLFGQYNFGRKIFVKLDGLTIGTDRGVATLGISGNRLEAMPESYLQKTVIRDNVTEDIVPLEISLADVSSDVENLYIRLSSVQFQQSSVLVDNPLTFAGEPTDNFNGERVLESCNSGFTTTLSSSTFSDFKSLTLPTRAGSVDGVLGRDFFDEKYILKINDVKAFNFDQERCDPLSCGTLENHAAKTFIDMDFEGQPIFGEVDIENWTNYIEAGSQSWETFTDNGTNASLGVSVSIGSFNSGDASSIAWLITPSIPIAANELTTFEFKSSTSFADDSVLTVQYATDWDGNEKNIPSANWKEIGDVDVALNDDFFGDWISSNIADLSCIEEDIHIAFKYEGGGNADIDGTYELDDILIKTE